MDERQTLLLKALVAMAWADHLLPDAERAFLRRVLASLGASPAEIEELEAAPQPVDLNQLADTLPGPAERREAMRLLLKVAFADEVLTFEEFNQIDRLAAFLSIDEEQLEQLRQEALKPED